MKNFLSLVLMFLMSCSGQSRKNLIEDAFGDELRLLLFEEGREKSRARLVLDSSEKALFEEWTKSLEDLKGDYRSFAPVVLVIGKRARVNFQKKTTIIELKEVDDPKVVWVQYSRAATEQDRMISEMLIKAKRKPIDEVRH